jgi:hypothetical protein
MAMRGWRRIGIILSVIWFLGFAIFLLLQPSDSARAYANVYCAIKQPGVTREDCFGLAIFDYESRHPRERDPVMTLIGISVVDLLTVALGWLIAWGCIALGRWVHRGFAEG